MDYGEFRKRLEAARALAAMQRLQAVEMLAQNVDLRHENGEAFTRERASHLRQDRQIRVQPDPIQTPHAER